MDSILFEKYFLELKNKITITGKVITEREEQNLRNNLLSLKVDKTIKLVNNYRHTVSNRSLETVINKFYENKCTMSGYGVLFKNGDVCENVPGRVIKFLLSERKVAKKKMFNHVNDVDRTYYENYDIIQKIFKLLGNSWYGSFAESNFQFFNPFLGPSVTYTGQHIIISAIMAFEGLLADNVKFYNFGEIIHFFYNIKFNESINEGLSLEYYEDITEEMFISRFSNNSTFTLTEDNIEYLKEVFQNTEPLLLEKYYFKNNLEEFLSKELITELFSTVFTNDFLNPEEPPESIKDSLSDINTLIDYYVCYPFQIPNKEHKIQTMLRKTILLTDTDSTFIYLDTVIQKVKALTGIPTNTQAEVVSLVNVFTYILTHFIAKVFYILTTNMGVAEDNKKLVNMKNEFLFSRVMLTRNKKSYASKVLMQEGKLFTKAKFDIKGIKIKTVNTPKPARILFTKILETEILDSDVIIPKRVFDKYVEFEKVIHQSIDKNETQFLKPTKYGVFERYAAPFQQQVVRGVLLWNALNPTEFIDNISQVYLVKFKPNTYEDLPKLLGKELFDRIEKEYFSIPNPLEKSGSSDKGLNDPYNDIIEDEEIENSNTDDEDEDGVVGKKETKLKSLKDYGLSCIAIPKSKETFPTIFNKLIDKTVIVNDVLTNGNILLECIGFTVVKSNNFMSYSNVLEF